jgi:ribonuclease HII
VVAAAAFETGTNAPCIKVGNKIIEVGDSKKIRHDRLAPLKEQVLSQAHAVEVIEVTAADVDKVGVHEAKMTNLALAAKRLVERLHIFNGSDREAGVIFDGLVDFELPFPFDQIPGADASYWQVGAASVLAKATQLEMMNVLHERYPRYMFYKNHGYPTQDHLERLKKYGPCKFHRRSTRALDPWRKKPKGRE